MIKMVEEKETKQLRMKDLKPGDLAIVYYDFKNRLIYVYTDCSTNSKTAVCISPGDGEMYWDEIELNNTTVSHVFKKGEKVTLEVV